jgi:hypothetical protein
MPASLYNHRVCEALTGSVRASQTLKLYKLAGNSPYYKKQEHGVETSGSMFPLVSTHTATPATRVPPHLKETGTPLVQLKAAGTPMAPLG